MSSFKNGKRKSLDSGNEYLQQPINRVDSQCHQRRQRSYDHNSDPHNSKDVSFGRLKSFQTISKFRTDCPLWCRNYVSEENGLINIPGKHGTGWKNGRIRRGHDCRRNCTQTNKGNPLYKNKKASNDILMRCNSNKIMNSLQAVSRIAALEVKSFSRAPRLWHWSFRGLQHSNLQTIQNCGHYLN